MTTGSAESVAEGAAVPPAAARRRPGPPRTYAPDEERGMMIGAAYEMLAGNPSGPVSLSEILARAGLSNRAFYRHFRSKDDLLLAMFEAESARLEAEVSQLTSAADGPRQALEIWIDRNLAISFDTRRMRRARVMLSPEMTRVAGYALAQTGIHQRQRDELARILERGAAAGVFLHTVPVADASLILDILSRIVVRRHDGVEEMDWDTSRRQVLDFVGRAIGSTG